jgi:exodeoxyribonuclease VII large subunit
VRLVDVLVGGHNAPAQIAHAIARLNQENNVDVIALVRGGGRVEELAVFNDIQIARAICQSAIPVITGIGHHQDDSLADQMADFSAITPTAAAMRLAKLAQGVGVARPQEAPQRLSLSTVIIIVLVLAVIGLVLLNLLQSAPGG